jgi:hypothetical protein
LNRNAWLVAWLAGCHLAGLRVGLELCIALLYDDVNDDDNAYENYDVMILMKMDGCTAGARAPSSTTCCAS